MTSQLFPFPGADGRQSNFVRSTTSAEQAQVPDLFLYSQHTFRFKPVQQNPTGNFGARISAFTATGYTAVAMVYRKSSGSAAVALATTGTMSWNAGGYFEGVLDLNTVEAIAAAGSGAAGAAVDVRFVFILLDGSSQPFICEQATRLFYTVPPDDLPDPESVTETIFADLLEAALVDTDLLTWSRSGNSLLGRPLLRAASALFDPLEVSFTELAGTASPANDEDSGVVASGVVGWVGKRFLVRARFQGTLETRGYNTGGLDARVLGDDSHVYRDGEPNGAGEANSDVWYLDVSEPAQRIHLNAASSPARESVDFNLEFVAAAGATLTLGFDTVDGSSTGPGSGTLSFVGAAVLNDRVDSREALSVSAAGNTDVTPAGGRHAAVVTVGAGAGSYTRTLALLTAGRMAGDLVLLRLLMPASANPTIEVRDATSGGTLLATIAGNATGSDYLVALGYTGSAWELLGVTSDAAIDLVAELAGKQPLATLLTNLSNGGPSLTANTLFQGTGVNSLQFTAFAANTFPARSSTGDLAAKTITDQALALLDDATAAAQRTTLGIEGRSVRLTATTTDATQTELLTSSGGRATLPDQSAWTFAGRLVARYAGVAGASWTARDSSRGWKAICSSADGTRLAAVAYGGQIYTSTDAGVTWTARESGRFWWGIACSSDGTKLVATVLGGQIFTSTDSGATWTARDTTRDWHGCASSADGTKLVAVVAGGQIYTSADSGANWTARDSSRDWQAVASSADGTKLAAVIYAGGACVYTSTDSGATWTARTTAATGFCNSIASSSDGTKLVIGFVGDQLYTSTDSGASWTARDSSRDWVGVACSADFTVQLASTDAGQLYTSTDSGAAWAARDSSRDWVGVTMASAGQTMAAVVNGGQIYTSAATSETQALHLAGKANRDTGAATVTVSGADELQRNPIGTFTWGFELDADTTNGSVRARFTGEASKPIAVALDLDFTEITN